MPVLPVTGKSSNWLFFACNRRLGRASFQAMLLSLLAFGGVAGAEETVFRSRGYCATPVVSQPAQSGGMGAILPGVMGSDVPVGVITYARDGEVKEVVFRSRSFCATSPAQQQASQQTPAEGTAVAPIAATVPDVPLYLLTSTGEQAPSRSAASSAPVVGAGITAGYSSGPASWMSAMPPSMPLMPEDVITSAPFPLAPTQAIRAGPLNLWPHLFYGLYYGNGIQARPGEQVKTATHVISPGIFMSFGDHWTLDYTPTKTVYLNEKLRDTFDHSVRLNGGYRYGEWIFKIEHNYVSSSSILLETATQTEREFHGTTLRIYYPFSSEMAWESEIHQNFQFLEQPQVVPPLPTALQRNSREWSTLNWVNYQLRPGLNVAIGPGGGHISVDPEGVDMTYEQLQGRIRWKATDKIYFVFEGGGENWQFDNSPVGDQMNPTYKAIIQYSPFQTTWLGLLYEHRMAPSYFEGLVTETSIARAYLQQRLLQKFKLIVGAQYGETEYQASQRNAITGTDSFYSTDIRLVTPFVGRGTISALWQYGKNASTRPGGYGLESTTIGVELQYQF